MKKRLPANLYRYGKILFFSCMAALLAYIVISSGFSFKFNTEYDNVIYAATVVIFLISIICALYALLSVFVNRAVFTDEYLKYRTLSKRYTIKYSDIIYIDGIKSTLRKQGSFLRTVKRTYKLSTKSGVYKLSSFEFFGLEKSMIELNDLINKIMGGNTGD